MRALLRAELVGHRNPLSRSDEANFGKLGDGMAVHHTDAFQRSADAALTGDNPGRAGEVAPLHDEAFDTDIIPLRKSLPVKAEVAHDPVVGEDDGIARLRSLVDIDGD